MATEPGSVQIGKVHMKVWPDTSNFEKELRAKIAAVNEPEATVEVLPDMDGFAAKVKAQAEAAAKAVKPVIETDGALKAGYLAELRTQANTAAERVSPKIDHRPALRKGYLAELRAMARERAEAAEQTILHRPGLAPGYVKELREASREAAGKVKSSLRMTPELKGSFATDTKRLAADATKKTHPVVRFAPGLQPGFRSKLRALATGAAASINPKINYDVTGSRRAPLPVPTMNYDQLDRINDDLTKGIGLIDLEFKANPFKFKNSSFWYSFKHEVREDFNKAFEKNPLKANVQIGKTGSVDAIPAKTTKSLKDYMQNLQQTKVVTVDLNAVDEHRVRTLRKVAHQTRMTHKAFVALSDARGKRRAVNVFEDTRKSMERTQKAAAATSRWMDRAAKGGARLSDRLGGISGRGARTNWLNLLGIGVRGLSKAVFEFPARALSTLTGGIGSMAKAFGDARDAGQGMISSLFKTGGGLAAALGVAARASFAFVAVLAVVLTIVSVAAAGIALLAGSLVALTSAIGYGLLGALVPVIPLLAAFGGGVLAIVAGAVHLGMVLSEDNKKFQSLRNEIEGAKKDFKEFGEEMAPSIARVTETLIGAGRALLEEFVPSVNTVMDDFNKMFNSAEMVPFFTEWKEMLPSIFEGIGKGMSDGLAGVTALLTPALGIADQSAASFERLMADFRSWATSDLGQSKITEWMDGATYAWENLKQIFSGVGSALGNIFSIAYEQTGRSWLDTLADKATEFGNWAASPQGQAQIESFFQSVKELGTELGDLAAAFGSLFDTLDGPKSRNAFIFIIDAFGAMLDTFHLVVLGVLAATSAINGNFADAGMYAQQFKDQYTETMNRLGTDSGQALADGLETSNVEVEGAARNLRNGAYQGILPLQSQVGHIGQQVGLTLAQNMQGTQVNVASAARNLRNGAYAGIIPLQGQAGHVGVQSGERLRQGLDSKRGAVRGAGSGLSSAVASALGVIPKNSLRSGVSSAERLRDGMNNNRGQVEGAAKNLSKSGERGLFGMPGLMLGKGRQAGQSTGTGISSASGTVTSASRGLQGAAQAGMAGSSGLLSSAGRLIVSGLAGSIASSAYMVRNALGAITRMIPDWKGPAPLDKVLLVPAGQMIIGGLIAGLESRFGDVEDSLGSLTASLNDAVADNLGTAEMSAMDNLNGKWSQMRDTLRGMRTEAERTSAATALMDGFEADNTVGTSRAVAASLAGANLATRDGGNAGNTFIANVDARGDDNNPEDVADALLFGMRSALGGGRAIAGGN